MERLTDMDVGIDKYFGYVVMNSSITRHHFPLARVLGDATKGRRFITSALPREEPLRFAWRPQRAKLALACEGSVAGIEQGLEALLIASAMSSLVAQ
jgi:hypothetical protein